MRFEFCCKPLCSSIGNSDLVGVRIPRAKFCPLPLVRSSIFLLSLAIGIAPSFGQLAADALATQQQYSQFDSDAARQRDESFQTPTEINSGQKCTAVHLQVVEAENELNGVQLRHHSYDGKLVGPTIRVKPGTQLKIQLQNKLPLELESAPDHDNRPHGLNTTNLHTHGLHVSPASPADNVFLEIAPKQSFDFVFDVDFKHPPGTFWYHPHKHGSTAFQLASGMSGALIIEGGLDEIPEINVAKEQIMVLEQFVYEQQTTNTGKVTQDSVYGNGTIVHAINGVVTPTIVMRPGEIQRWRIIHAGTADAISLDLEGILFQEIAVDGLATGRMDEKKALILYPGYRSDVLIQAPNVAGTKLMYTAIRDPAKSIRNQIIERSNLLRLVIEGAPQPMSFPSRDQLKKVAAFQPEDVPKDNELNGPAREILFNMGADFFHVNNKPFSGTRIDHELTVGTAEEWNLKALRGIHPFHIHVNPFAVRPVNAGDPWIWRDTYVVSREQPVTLRTRYVEHVGDTVLHCHNLIHEDLGMMQRIKLQNATKITERAKDPFSSPNSTTASRWSAIDLSGNLLSSETFQGKFVLLVLHRGIECVHCAQQINRLQRENDRLLRIGVRVVAIGSKKPQGEEARQFLSQLPFPLLVDDSMDTFRAFDCVDDSDQPLHGLFLLDQESNCLFAYRSDTAMEDPTGWVERLLLSNQGEKK